MGVLGPEAGPVFCLLGVVAFRFLFFDPCVACEKFLLIGVLLGDCLADALSASEPVPHLLFAWLGRSPLRACVDEVLATGRHLRPWIHAVIRHGATRAVRVEVGEGEGGIALSAVPTLTRVLTLPLVVLTLPLVLVLEIVLLVQPKVCLGDIRLHHFPALSIQCYRFRLLVGEGGMLALQHQLSLQFLGIEYQMDRARSGC